ncbi:ester cyclase [Terrimonas pollutisoli]|uniref:ester cyclase n=1 Tax=Terrimonas pollutisoli TaxID=3034147 RepID=UPI0023EBD357|nr:ester cyclase [Terrimonas sp. H1YJ31]
MKKSLLAISSCLFLFCMSCNNKAGDDKMGAGKMSDQTEKNIAASHVVVDAFQSGDVSKIDDAVASDFVDHTERGDMGRDSLKSMIKMWHGASKDNKMEIIKELADDEYVFSWMRFTGTSDGSMGMPAGPYDMRSIEVVKFKDGKAIEHWGFMEPREMMKWMQQMPAMDTTKKK